MIRIFGAAALALMAIPMLSTTADASPRGPGPARIAPAVVRPYGPGVRPYGPVVRPYGPAYVRPYGPPVVRPYGPAVVRPYGPAYGPATFRLDVGPVRVRVR